MKLIILSESNALHSTTRLLEEAKIKNIPAESINIYEKSYLNRKLVIKKQVILGRYSGVRFDDYDLLYMKNEKRNGSVVHNCPEKVSTFRQKCSQVLFFQENNIPHIDTITLRGLYKKKELKSIISQEFVTQSWDQSTFLVKMTRGNQGRGITLIKGIDSLVSFNETFNALKDQRYIIQPYLNIEKEYRVLIINNVIQGALEKEIDDDFRANSKRCKSIFINTSSMPKDLIEIVQKCINKSGLFYSGIDVAFISNEYRIIEINSNPGFEDFETKSHINIASIIIEEITKQV